MVAINSTITACTVVGLQAVTLQAVV